MSLCLSLCCCCFCICVTTNTANTKNKKKKRKKSAKSNEKLLSALPLIVQWAAGRGMLANIAFCLLRNTIKLLIVVYDLFDYTIWGFVFVCVFVFIIAYFNFILCVAHLLLRGVPSSYVLHIRSWHTYKHVHRTWR